MYEEVFSDDDGASSTFTILTTRHPGKASNKRGVSKPPSAWRERMSDPEFHAIRIFNRDTAQWERVYFYENQYVKQGRIRHAITGNYFDIRAGDLAENLLFKVCISMQKDPYMLFFHTPEEYERHFCLELSRELKATWSEKQAYYYRMLKPQTGSLTGLSTVTAMGVAEEEKVIIVK